MKSFLSTVHSPELVDRMNRIIPIATRRKFDDDEMVQYLSQRIGFEDTGAFQFEYADGYVTGQTEFSIKGPSHTKWMYVAIADIRNSSQQQAGKFAQNNQTSYFMPKMMYGILKGLTLRKMQNPQLDIRIIGHRVANKMLKTMFTEFGFVYDLSRKPLSLTEMETGWRTLYLDLHHVQDW